ncbi:MAG: 50S ribosomal protein L11 methyltransferase [Desulfobulbaceae bacterium]|uniref:50S ribosomal protein L11 methyltransferase n=1 Tax=Candidatus Desulfobia pelagia TaxID=2841692 RepID=A0A8J6TFY8_9BACT|nr:50S ribosomal protein L11 methyltransferase [Candidatus Desulfobia pelagia]
MDISEWNGVSGQGRLHVQIQVAGTASAAELRSAMSNLQGDVRWDGDAGQLHIVADPLQQDDFFLRELDGLIESFNSCREESEQAEILETRLVQPFSPVESTPLFPSRFQIQSQAGPGESDNAIVLDADRSFGSGTHPSTRLVLHLLENFIGTPFPERVLDVGCGSGILSLVSARLGARDIVGMDVCPHAVEVASRNVKINQLEGQVTITDAGLGEIKGIFDLILANLTPSVLYRLSGDIRYLSAAGKTTLIVSGLQGRQVDEIAAFLSPQGWNEEQRLSAGKWQALLFTL